MTKSPLPPIAVTNLDWWNGLYAGRRGGLALCRPPSRAQSPGIADPAGWLAGHAAGRVDRQKLAERHRIQQHWTDENI